MEKLTASLSTKIIFRHVIVFWCNTVSWTPDHALMDRYKGTKLKRPLQEEPK